MKFYIVALASIAVASISQATLKLVAMSMAGPVNMLKDGRFYVGGILMVVAFLGWMIAASRIEFSRLIPMNALSLVIAGCVGAWLFDEMITRSMALAYALIITGVALLTLAK